MGAAGTCGTGRATAILGFLLLAGGAPRTAAASWAVEVHAGGAWNVPLPLVIRQEGHEDIRLRARWHTRALEFPIYYVGRFLTHDERAGWALDLTHHKIYLANPPTEVQRFAVSHGYNLLMIHRLAIRGTRRYGVGAGVVVAHPESEVRGRPQDEHGGPLGGGYHFGGPAIDALASWVPARRNGLHAVAEARFTAAYARVPIAGGHARVPNVALHLTIGAGWGGAR